MTWNYRVMTLNRGESYEIHEVYYNEEGRPSMYSANSVKPFGENIEDLTQNLQWMLKALQKSVLTPQDFPEPKE